METVNTRNIKCVVSNKCHSRYLGHLETASSAVQGGDEEESRERDTDRKRSNCFENYEL